MAFYNDAPGRKPQKKNHAAGSWADEGSQYRNAGRTGGYRSDRDDRREGGYRGDRPAGGFRKDFRSNDREDRREGGYRSDRPAGGFRKDFRSNDRGDRPAGGYRKDDRFDRSDRPARRDSFDPRPASRKPLEPRPAPSFRDSEYRPSAPVAPVAPMPMEDAIALNENLLAGRNPIREALKAGRDIEKLLVQKGELTGSAREIVQLAREMHIVVQEVEKIRLDELARNHQGLIAFASAYQYSTVEAMLEEAAAKGEDPFLILLDGVTDPHNLGAIIRSAECVGAHGVIVPERRSVGLTPAAVKASAGAVEHMKVARVVNLGRTIDDLKARNIWTYALTMDGADYERVDFKGGVALIVGSEGEGVSRLVLEKCDQKVSLPMAGHIDSLNASVAAGVMMYRVFSSRK